MKRNMNEWIREVIAQDKKKGMPILSFPGAKILDVTVDELVKDGHLQALCMESIAKKYDMGMAVSLMDLSVEAEAFGSPVQFETEEVPTVREALIHDEEEAEELKVPAVGAGRTGECVKGIREACERITDRPVFAGIIGPYSLAGRLLDMTEIMILCYEEPEMVETVLEKATEFLIAYAKAFKNAGANGVVMAEPAAGLLSPGLMEEFSNPYVKKVREAVEDDSFVVMYHNCGNIEPLLGQIRDVDAKAYSFGNAIDMEKALQVIPQDRLVIGNIDPAGVLRNGTPELVREETKKLLERCRKYPNFVIASGCDIPPMTPFENMDAFFETIEEFYK
ncbi:MAG: uroporphyrinogen decarboxylase family protein [Oliverpabstia sp.]|nr:uroporphyrinogen decarboxylase family protein [Oliverpabstia sp.]